MRPALFAALLLATAAPAAANGILLLDAGRGGPPGGFASYSVMEAFMTDRGFTVVRSAVPLAEAGLDTVRVVYLDADWMADGAHPPADRAALAAFVDAGGSVIVHLAPAGPGVDALAPVLADLGMAVDGSTAGGKVRVTDHPSVVDLTGLTVPPGVALDPGGEGESVGLDPADATVLAAFQRGNARGLITGCPIWRNDLWNDGREDVLRRTLGWMAPVTPVEPSTWGRLKRHFGPVRP
jgi:hypothetical protein